MAKIITHFNADAIKNPVKRATAKALIYSALDVKRQAQASMRRAINQETHSEPGEPPFYFKGTLRNLIRWEMTSEKGNRILVGSEKVGNARQSVPRILEKGETVVPEKTVRRLKENYRRRRFSPENIRDQNVNKYGERRTGRPFRKKRDPKTKKLQRYEYFYSKARWEAAREAPAFHRWWLSVSEEVKVRPFKVKSRPYMEPALEAVALSGALERNFKNAIKKEFNT